MIKLSGKHRLFAITMTKNIANMLHFIIECHVFYQSVYFYIYTGSATEGSYSSQTNFGIPAAGHFHQMEFREEKNWYRNTPIG